MKEILKFETNNCAPCAQVSQMLNHEGVTYTAINPFNEPDLAAKYKIRAVPTTILLENGDEISRVVGLDIKPLIENYKSYAEIKISDKSKISR